MKPRRSLAPTLVLILAGIALAVGMAQLFELRFSAGDVYPPYSTLRSDPLGTKALYVSLGELPGMRVERNLRPLTRLSGADEASLALFYLGASPADWPSDLFDHDETARLDVILRHGGRIILAFGPAQSLPTKVHRPAPSPSPSPAAKEPDFENLARRWAIDFHRIDPNGRAPRAPAMSAAVAEAGQPIEPGASWHSSVDFELDAKATAAGWRAVYRRGGRPVVVERDYPGGGRLILASDSYLFSNEALRNEPHPALLADLIGPVRRLVFEETHFGVAENPGWMTLARRFHLEGAMAGLAVLAGLFLWKSASSLVPSQAETEVSALEGRDNATGFLNLVRRAVPARDLLATCVRHWEPGANPAALHRVRTALEAENARPRKERNLAAAYRAMCAAAARNGIRKL